MGTVRIVEGFDCYGSLGAAAFSLVVSYTPLGKRIDHLAETFLGVAEGS